ncbi:MAG: helix-turn-helix domain-containing protein [Pseudomonadota bacterium]
MKSENQKFARDTEVAQRFGISRSTVWRWVREGIVPAPIKIAGSTRFDLQAVDEAIDREAAKNAAA